MSDKIESVMHEARSFAPSKQFSKEAHIKTEKAYEREYKRAIDSPEKFWAGAARKLDWFKKWDKALEWNAPFARWFVGGEINACHNCVDRHLATRGDHEAIIWEGEPGETKRITFKELHREVSKFANVLKDNGVATGDRVALYMPMVPELAIAMLACARIGATHSIIFGGFSAQAIRDRVADAGASAVITADGGYRRGKPSPLKDTVDEALEGDSQVKKVFVVQRCRNEVKWVEGRDVWWHEAMENASEECPPERLDANHPLFILYTSGTTGKPKGIYHGTGGYMTYAYTTSKFVFDLKDDDIFWCTADIGWITGHSYVIYGALSNGVTTVMYEGTPDYPDKDRFWNIIQKLRPTIFYTAPTAIRAFIKWGDEYVRGRDLSSLRLLGTVGEPINPEAWIWYHRKIGNGACPIVDTWWQTETGGIMISPLPGAIPTKPGSCTRPFFGIDADVFDDEGNPCGPGEGGLLVIKKPWPGMMLGVWGDEARYKETYWSKFGENTYFAGDGAYKDKDGYFWVVGRIDDVVNISGHRLGTAEVESALVSHAKVAEAAVVGKPHEVKGQCIEAFVSLKGGIEPSKELAQELKDHVAKEIGAIAKPEAIRFTQALPKTRSGKIMRRLLRDIAAGKEAHGDMTTLEDAAVLEKIAATEED